MTAEAATADSIPDFDAPAPEAGHNNPPEPIDPLVESLNAATERERARHAALIAAYGNAPDVIDSDDVAEKVVTLTAQMKDIGKTLEEKRKDAKKPLDEQVKKIQGFFNPFKDRLDASVKDLERRLSDWTRRKAAAARAEQERLQQEAAARIAAAKSNEEAEEAIAEAQRAQDTAAESAKTRSPVGAQTVTRTVKKHRISDEAALPREYLMPDEKKIAAAVKAGIAVSGVEVYTEETTHVR